MPIPGPSPVVVSDDVAQTDSPFAVRLNGAWVTLEGVVPGVAQTIERARSEFESLGGHRYAQQAPRANREWTLDFRHATPAAVAALALAAEAPGDVLLIDGASAVANMLDPRTCYGHDQTATVIDCSGIPLRGLPDSVTVRAVVRGGVAYTFGAWSLYAAGFPAVQVAYPGGVTYLNSVGAGVRAEVSFAPIADGEVEFTTGGGVPFATTGLQLVEGDLPPTWLAGERAICKVSVSDPSRTLNMLRSGSRGRSDYSVTLREVG